MRKVIADLELRKKLDQASMMLIQNARALSRLSQAIKEKSLELLWDSKQIIAQSEQEDLEKILYPLPEIKDILEND